jgi:hypothetical protein
MRNGLTAVLRGRLTHPLPERTHEALIVAKANVAGDLLDRPGSPQQSFGRLVASNFIFDLLKRRSLYGAEGQDSAAVARLLKELEQNNPVSRGLLLPHGESLPLGGVRRVLGFLPSWMEALRHDRPRCVTCLMRASSEISARVSPVTRS